MIFYQNRNRSNCSYIWRDFPWKRSSTLKRNVDSDFSINSWIEHQNIWNRINEYVWNWNVNPLICIFSIKVKDKSAWKYRKYNIRIKRVWFWYVYHNKNATNKCWNKLESNAIVLMFIISKMREILWKTMENYGIKRIWFWCVYHNKRRDTFNGLNWSQT